MRVCVCVCARHFILSAADPAEMCLFIGSYNGGETEGDVRHTESRM